MSIDYEWDVEEWDEHGDIINHDHSDKLSLHRKDEVFGNPVYHLVLVRDSYHGADLDRSWAYVSDGKLPEFFEDAYQEPVAQVPKRFHKELEKFLSA